MTYWLNLFTGTTWAEFQKANSTISGFRDHSEARARAVRPGDIFLCYLVGVKRWVGLLEILGVAFRDESRIFREEVFPIRFEVKPIVALTPVHGVPMEAMRGKLSFYALDTEGKTWSGRVRSSLIKYSQVDGDAIRDAINGAAVRPVVRPVDAKQLSRPVNLYTVKVSAPEGEVERVVVIPTADDESEKDVLQDEKATAEPTHSEIQWRLLDLGSQMGLEVWAPRRDRGRTWNGKSISQIPRLKEKLPTQFDENTNRTIEEIDVLWLQGQTIVAAFEVEHSTSIFSGLLRMSDLLTMQPNITINIHRGSG